MIDLPNNNWLRSTTMPEYAICLDPDGAFFGWKMIEHADGKWVSVAALTASEIQSAKQKPDFNGYEKQLEMLG